MACINFKWPWEMIWNDLENRIEMTLRNDYRTNRICSTLQLIPAFNLPKLANTIMNQLHFFLLQKEFKFFSTHDRYWESFYREHWLKYWKLETQGHTFVKPIKRCSTLKIGGFLTSDSQNSLSAKQSNKYVVNFLKSK